MHRIVTPEVLDSLSPSDARAIRARADLRRLNRIMGHLSILRRTLQLETAVHSDSRRCIRVCELGAGDGTISFGLSRHWAKLGLIGNLILVDRLPPRLNELPAWHLDTEWSVEWVTADALEWLAKDETSADVMFANLFLHHFSEEQLKELLTLAALKTRLFVACEPRRGSVAKAAARLVGVIACNDVTRHDAVVSVEAGFTGKELSGLWPAGPGWQLTEGPAGWFSHYFAAHRFI